MLSNKEYSQIITALFYSTIDGKTVSLAAANSMLRIFTKEPGEVKFDTDQKTLVISESPKKSFFYWGDWTKKF